MRTASLVDSRRVMFPTLAGKEARIVDGTLSGSASAHSEAFVAEKLDPVETLNQWTHGLGCALSLLVRW